MRFPRFRSPFASRRLIRALEGINAGISAQNALILRLADQFAPKVPENVESDTGASFLREDELVTVMDYKDRTYRETGHLPTDEEAVAYLAELKTHDLVEKLSERERQLNDLQHLRP